MSTTASSDPISSVIAALEALPSRSRLSDADTEVIYAFAYQLVAQKHFDEASRYFSFLLLYRPTTVKYLAGLALCHKMFQLYEAAAGVYAFMALVESDEPQHHLNIAECLLLQGQTHKAHDMLTLVSRFCQENPGHEQTARRAEAIASLLSGQTADAA